MTISKKLFLITTLIIGSQANMKANEFYDHEQAKKQRVFNFALSLRQQNSADAQIAQQWLENNLLRSGMYNYYILDKVIMILDAKITLEEKIQYILKAKESTEKTEAEYKAHSAQDDQRYAQQRKGELEKQQEESRQKQLILDEHKRVVNREFWYNAIRDAGAAATILAFACIISKAK